MSHSVYSQSQIDTQRAKPVAALNSFNMDRPAGYKVLVVGAGSMGIIVGYYLKLAGAQVTFLVRPQRAKELNRPQILYCYNDNQLKTFSDYKYFTNPSEIANSSYDYIIITLDAASLRSEEGRELVKMIGQATHGTKTGVIVGAVFPEIKAWFLEASGLSDEQVINGLLYVHIYPTQRLRMLPNPSVDQKLIDKADFAYTDSLGPSLVVDNSSPLLASSFVDLYNRCGVSHCGSIELVQAAVNIFPMFTVFAACELLDWPKFGDIDSNGQVWRLTVEAMKEIQELGIHGESGRTAAQATTAEAVLTQFQGMESVMLPFDLQTFNRFHHGSKVNVQDRQILGACLNYGIAEGKPMAALRDLLQRVENHSQSS